MLRAHNLYLIQISLVSYTPGFNEILHSHEALSKQKWYTYNSDKYNNKQQMQNSGIGQIVVQCEEV